VLFEWDPAKAARSYRKHRISFHEAATVFGDPLAITFDDPDHSESERRFITVGMSGERRVLLVAHTERGERIRIISARQATPREREQYEEEN
jgi:uncharacterized DUF497 family protein